jgi:hypothetical protein
MLFRNMMMKYHAEADDVPAGGGAADAPVKTYTQVEVEEMTRGLRESRDTLLAEKKSVSAKAKEADAARIAAEQEAAKTSGEMDKFEKTIRSQYEPVIAERDAKLQALTDRVLGESKKAVLGAFIGDFMAPESVDIIAQLVKTDFDGSDVRTQFVDFAGNVITTSPAEFKKWMTKHPAISHLMRADAATGGGAVGGKGTQQVGGAGNSKNEIINRRLTGLDARLKQS